MATMHARRAGRLLALLVVLWPAFASSQIDGDLEETQVESFGLDTPEEGERLLEDAQAGPTQVGASEFETSIDIEVIERSGAAVSRLEGLIEDTPEDDPARAEYMFRLAELKYQRARYYEQRAFNYRDEAFTIRDENPQRARVLEENAAGDLEFSDQLAAEAIDLYAELYRLYASTYADIDAVLYYLGANMLQLGQNAAARTMFETLALEYPRSPFLPQAYLMLAELDFVDGEMSDALTLYNAVIQFPDSSVYPYALYKRAWCLYNLSESTADFEGAVQQLLDAIVVAEGQEGRERLVRDALRDMTLFYSEIYPADTASAFFAEIAPGQELDLIERLARIYGDRGLYQDSNYLYRELIAANPDSYRVVGYQTEILNNTRPGSTEVEIVRELRRLLALYEQAESFEDFDPAVHRTNTQTLERLTRQLATTYHREGQVTANTQLYALAYELYGDYMRHFADISEHGYSMWVYYGDLLFRDENYLEAARAYERALELSDGTGQYDERATFAACIAYSRMLPDANPADAQGVATSNADDLPPEPQPVEIPEDYTRMIAACDRYRDMDSSEETAVQIEYITAYMYYEFHHLDEAIDRFGQLAMNRYHVDPVRARVSAELLLDSLALKRRFTEMSEWIRTFQANDTINQGELASRLVMLSAQVDFLVCRGLHSDAEYEEAGLCYIDFAENHFESELLCRAFFNAALAFEAAAKLDYSLSAHDFLIQYCPDSDLVPETLFELGRTYQRMAMYRTAAEYYEQYVETPGPGEHVRDALIEASQFRAGLGDWDQAVTDLRTFMRVADDDDEEQRAAIAEAAFQVARVYHDSGAERDAIDAYERFIDDHGDILPQRAVEAHVNIADLYEEREYPDRAAQWYASTVTYWQSLDPEARAQADMAARGAAARAQFMMGESIYEEFEAIPLEGTEAEVQAAIAEKIDVGRRAAAEYTRVLDIGHAGWAIASFTRLGQLRQVFYEQIIDSPIPDFSDPLEAEVYREQLEIQAAQQKDEAMTAYAQAISISRDAGYYSEYSDLAAALYQELDPTFKAGTEVRIAPGYETFDYYRAPFVVPSEDADEESAAADDGDGDGPRDVAPEGK